MVTEFYDFYKPDVNASPERDFSSPERFQRMKNTDSNETLRLGDHLDSVEARLDQSPVEILNEVVSETTPLLNQDVEAQSPQLESNTKFYAMVATVTTVIVVGCGISYALMNGYITELPF